ncbi:16S rRNA (uracil(1498)-N(3))-methyltransferase [Thiomicrospira microaerophila]|uniref:16S rRNA (uracil(1498)-N(3))-methyltransferase n=1 Tax=Thiomicrospira microaerophila TaxID=406020 RepID=UPI0005C893EA|nr:16S rRNA (uracil(1498)-N(3))-methyltransferase [Thiomicrospira microaerophila]
MRIPRLYLAVDLQPGLVVNLNKDQAHYALTVLRLKNAHPVQVFDGLGQQIDGVLQILSRRDAQVLLGEHLERPNTESPLNTLLLQGISRGERMDYSLQKAVELGVTEIQPLFTDRCEVRLDADKAEKRRQQWQALVISACEQSGRAQVPIVHAPVTLEHWIGQLTQPAQGLVLDPYAQQTLQTISKPSHLQAFALLVGPEGGLTDMEVQLAQNAGLTAIRLGSRILRTETAAPVILSLLQAQWGDLN